MQLGNKPNRQQQRREASYRALINSAMHRFHDHGYAATTIQDIVAATPYTHGAFYHHFENKADCFWQVIAHREQLRGDWYTLPDRLDPHATSLEQLLEQVFTGFARTLEGLNAWVLVMVDLYQQHREDPDAQARLAAIYERWQHELEQFIAALQKGGWIPQDRDPALLATEAFAYQEGLAIHANLYSLNPDTFQAAVTDGLLALLTNSRSIIIRPSPKRRHNPRTPTSTNWPTATPPRRTTPRSSPRLS